MKNTKCECGVLHLLFTDKGKDLALLILRIVFGVMMITHGLAKIADFANLSMGFPDPIGLGSKTSLILIICAEVGASALIIIGAITRLAAIPLIFGMVVAAFILHSPVSLSGSELPLIYLAFYICLLICGAGKYSVDGLISGRCEKK